MVASILGRTAADSSLTGSSLASGASVSDGAADDAVAAAAPPVTSSLSFWFSCLNHQQSENDGLCEQCPFPEFVDILVQRQDVLREEPIKPTGCNDADRKHWNNPPHQKWKYGYQHPRQLKIL